MSDKDYVWLLSADGASVFCRTPGRTAVEREDGSLGWVRDARIGEKVRVWGDTTYTVAEMGTWHVTLSVDATSKQAAVEKVTRHLKHRWEDELKFCDAVGSNTEGRR